jgi:hypothetical protein
MRAPGAARSRRRSRSPGALLSKETASVLPAIALLYNALTLDRERPLAALRARRAASRHGRGVGRSPSVPRACVSRAHAAAPTGAGAGAGPSPLMIVLRTTLSVVNTGSVAGARDRLARVR